MCDKQIDIKNEILDIKTLVEYINQPSIEKLDYVSTNNNFASLRDRGIVDDEEDDVLDNSQYVQESDEEESLLQNNKEHSNNDFYDNAKKYWSSIEPTVNGMLGGFESIHLLDVRGSQYFLKDIFKMKPSPNRKYALDCGAGIGRVTKHVLIEFFDKIDMVEQDQNFVNSSREYLGNTCSNNVECIFNEGLQDFTPEANKYDVIWCQWVLGHLENDDLIKFFQRCIKGLGKNGVLILKENVTTSGGVDIDKIDSSVTRPLILLKSLIIESNMKIIKIQQQNKFPKGIFPVYMIAARPIKSCY